MKAIYKNVLRGLIFLLFIPFYCIAQETEKVQEPEFREVAAYNNYLFEEVQNPALNPDQQRYANTLIREGELSNYTFIRINTKILESQSDATLYLNIPGRNSLPIRRTKSYRVSGKRLVWIGASNDYSGFVRFVVHKDVVSGNISLVGLNHSIFPLSRGLHIIYADQDAVHKGCDEEGEQHGHVERPDYSPYDPGSQDDEQDRSLLLGECSLRFMVVFTQAVKSATPDVTTLCEGFIADYNTYNANSNVDYTVELARVIGTNYVATGASENHPTYGNDSQDMIRLFEPADGFMDEMHTIRNQYDADFVTLLVTTLHGGLGGEALPIGAMASDAFNTMLWNNGNSTFAHEAGHLFGKRHSHDNNNSPYAYGHGWHVASSFATIMAYTNQCSPCVRVPNWSNPNINVMGVPSGTVAFADAARVGREQDQNMAAFQGTVSNKFQFTNDVIDDEEQADLYGDNFIETDFQTVTFESGSVGSYRARDRILLEQGFHVKTGAYFRAFLDNCSAMNIADPHPIVASRETADEDDDYYLPMKTELKAVPNPFKNHTTIEIQLGEAGNVSIDIFDAQGHKILTLLDNKYQEAGAFQLEFNSTGLPSGIYICRMISNGKPQTIKLMLMDS